MSDIDHLSASSIQLFLRCPEAWRRKYLCGEVEPPTAAMQAGTRAHEYLEQVLRSGINLGVEWRRDEWDHAAPQAEDQTQAAIRAAVVGSWGRPIEAETEFVIARPDYSIVGRIDAICESSDPWQSVIYDLKVVTKPRLPDRVATWEKYWVQLALYSAARQIRNTSILAVSTSSYRVARHRFVMSEEYHGRVLNLADVIWWKVQAGEFIPDPEPAKCHQCWYRPSCKYTRQ